jgi:Pleckstrin homology domain
MLKLNDEERQILRDGKLILRKNYDAEMQVFLFDHLFLVAKKKEASLKVVKRPIPLELLNIIPDKAVIIPQGQVDTSKTFPINFSVPTKFGGPFSLFALSHADRVSWIVFYIYFIP